MEERPTRELTASAADLAAQFAARRPDPRLTSLLANYPDHVFNVTLYASIEAVDRLATALAIEVAESVGILPHLTAPLSVVELQPAAGYAADFAPALAWVLERLAAAELISVHTRNRARRFTATGPLPASDAAAIREAALMIDPANAATCDLLDTAAAACPAIARGEISGRDGLLGQGQMVLWLRYFSNDNPLYAVNNWISAVAAADRLAAQQSEGKPLRILELGAGAGSGSSRLLDVLQQRGLASHLAEVRITEPSALFARKSQRALGPYRSLPLCFAALNMDQSWQEQGIDDGSFDLVYAVNVLHVARDLSFSLRAAHRALRPGGWLVAGECLRPDAHAPLYVELVFRLLEDPTVVTDPRTRPTAGFLEWRHWRAALAAAGFSKISSEPDHERIVAIYPKLFVAALCGRA